MTARGHRAPTGLKRSVHGAILLAAQDDFLQWLRVWGQPRPAEAVERLAFNELGRAVKAMQRALRHFDGTHPGNRAALLAGLQASQAPVFQSRYLDQLAELDKLLGLMGLAAARAGGRGAQADARCRAWVCIAADRWHRETNELPSAAERGHFWQAIERLQSDTGARAIELPILTREMVRDALKAWRELQGLPE